MKIFVTDHDGKEHALEAEVGWRVMEIIRDWDVGIKAECGGACSCATCHIYVAEEWEKKLIAPTDEELDMLDTAPDVEDNSRLSCQIIMKPEFDGLRVTLAPGSEPF
ncbi:MAG: 2Fe-2S iron-sulfur cluster-binding protein [Pseudomonadota bacterium]